MEINRELIEGTLDIVRGAGEIILDHWNRPKNITYKGPIDLVTETDLAAEEHLKTRLGELLPEAGMVAEESHDGGEFPDLAWIVDPLDGTTNFAHQIPFVAVSVGLMQSGYMMLGVVHLPILKETFWAARGQGAFLNNEKISVSGQDDLGNGLAATGFHYNVRDITGEVLEQMDLALKNTRGLRRCGSAASDMAYLACGRYDVFYEIGLKPWDTAAGWLLVEEAGGLVTQYNPIGPYSLGARTILATNGKLHRSMIQLIGK